MTAIGRAAMKGKSWSAGIGDRLIKIEVPFNYWKLSTMAFVSLLAKFDLNQGAV